MKIKVLFLLIGWIFAGQQAMKAQSLENLFTLHQDDITSKYISLEESLSHLETKFKATFVYRSDLVEGKEVLLETLIGDELSDVLFRILDPYYLEFEEVAARHYTILPKIEVPEKIIQETVTGTVTDVQNNDGLPGVNILIKGTSQGTSTSADGSFEIMVPSLQDTLIVSYIGYRTREVPLQGQTTLQIALQPEAVAGDEVIVVGYGTQRKADLTGSVSTVDVERTLNARPITDLGKGLQGAIPGLTITTPTGEIGTNPSIRLRGLRGSLNTGNAGAQPLILVDNVEVENLNMINPGEIESISVLKDAASTAIYGTRGAWGVILINTKSGTFESTPQVSYTNNFSWSTPTNKLEIAPAADGVEVALAAIQRRDPSTNSFGIIGMHFDEISIEKMREWEELYGNQDLSNEMVMGRDFEIRDGQLFFYRPWDAGEMYLKDWTPMQNHSLSISGGSENISYNLGVGYTGQEGVLKVKPDQWDRYNVNLTLNSRINNWLDARGNVMWTQTTMETPYNYMSSTYDYWYYLYRWQKTYPYGTYEGLPFRSPITEVQQANMNEDTRKMARITLGGTVTLAENLTIDADYTYSNNNRNIHTNGGTAQGYNFWAGSGLNYGTYTTVANNRVRYTTLWSNRNNFRLYSTWQNDLQDHSFTLMGGTDMEVYEGWNHYSERRDKLDNDKGELSLAIGDQYAGGGRGNWATMGFFSRFNYSFRDKYLFQVNARYDGSSRFPTNDQWALFPSVSAGYVISRESFMDFTKSYLSFLKIRGSWGTVGNQDVGSNAFISTMSNTSSGWLIGNTNTAPTFTTPSPVSSSLTWEKVTTLDVGFDAGFFDDRLSMAFDWYNRTTSNMISAGVTLPGSFGASAPSRNFGEMQTRGWEMEVKWNHVVNNDLHFFVSGSLSDFQEKITKFPDATNALPNPISGRNWNYYEGMTIGEIWGYETDGFFTVDDFEKDANGDLIRDQNGRYILKEEIADQNLFESSWFFFGPGDIRYKDLDGDGSITYGSNTVDNPGDRRIIGNSTPRYQYGINLGGGWKGIDMNVFLQGVGKRELWANGPIFIPGYRPHEAWYTHQMDYWTPDNTDALYPRPTDALQQVNPTNFQPQTRYMLDMSYLRLKNITIGYTLSPSVLGRTPLTDLRVYISGENLLELDKVDLPIDPEMDYTTAGLNDPNTFGRVYPFQRSIALGVEISF